MASRRAALAPLSVFKASAGFDFVSASSSLHEGHRLANPGLPGFSSNSSPQTTQVLIGNGSIDVSILPRTAKVSLFPEWKRGLPEFQLGNDSSASPRDMLLGVGLWCNGSTGPRQGPSEGSNPSRSIPSWEGLSPRDKWRVRRTGCDPP
jgi:hypothetical protein